MKRVSQLAVVLVLGALAFAQNNEVAPNENLVAEGIPKIPVSLAESVGRYSEFRSAFFVGWHSTRREMLIETRFADTYQVHQVKFPGGARTQLTFFPDRIAGARYQPAVATPSYSEKTSEEESSTRFTATTSPVETSLC